MSSTIDIETRTRAINRLARALLVFTVGVVVLAGALAVALVVGLVNITIESTVGRVRLTAALAKWFSGGVERITDWFMANVLYIAGGRGECPDLIP